MTRITETQKTLLDELLEDYDGNPESLLTYGDTPGRLEMGLPHS